ESILRTSQVPSMLRTIQWNLYHGIRDLQLYELGKTYRHGEESRSLILAATGALRKKNVHEAERDFNFFDLKGDVESILDVFSFELKPDSDSIPTYYHSGRVLRYGDLVTLGELHPALSDDYKFRKGIYSGEIDGDILLESKGHRAIVGIPKFPSIRRDFSLILNKDTRYADVERAIHHVKIPELVRIEPFDRLEVGPFAE